MKQVAIDAPGGPEQLVFRDVPEPIPRLGEVLVSVEAVGLNRADILQRRGVYPAPPGVVQDVPGLEYSGVIEQIGEGVHGMTLGARVMGIVPGGAYSEKIVVPASDVLVYPPFMTPVEAACVPEAFLTAYDALILQAGMRSGDRVLVHAAASGVGVAATQLAKALGAKVYGTTRSQHKIERLSEFGVDVPLLASEAWDDQLLAVTDAQGVDIVLDLVGGDYVGRDVRVLANRGRIVVVGLLRGVTASIPLAALLSKRATLIGTVLRSRPAWERIDLTQRAQEHLMPLISKKMIWPVVDRVFPMSAVSEAHRVMENNELVGCAALVWGHNEG